MKHMIVFSYIMHNHQLRELLARLKMKL